MGVSPQMIRLLRLIVAQLQAHCNKIAIRFWNWTISIKWENIHRSRLLSRVNFET